MNEIKLSVEDAELQTVLNILENLKSGLIKNIEVNSKSNKVRHTQYQPKTNNIVREEDSGVNDSSGKYANPAAYKQRLKKK